MTPQDVEPLKAVAVALKAAKPGLLLTWPVNSFGLEVPPSSLLDLSPSFDRVNVMSYGLAGAWSEWDSWHSSALSGEANRTPTSVESVVQAYLSAGIPAQKLGVGVGFFGLCYTGVSGPRQLSQNMTVAGGDNDISYTNILSQYLPGMTKQWDTQASVPYLSAQNGVGPKACTYLSYEDAQSVAAKGKYAQSQGLGGVIIWTLAQGHLLGKPAAQADPLLDSTYRAFRY